MCSNSEPKESKDEAADADMEMDSTSKPRRSNREIKRIQEHNRTQRIEKNKRKKPRNQVAFPSRKKGGKK